jgi:prevent-host-death family protein
MDIMKITTFTELRNNARKLFDAVEAGEAFEVYRHGRPVAVIYPAAAKVGLSKRWKGANPQRLLGGSLSRAIMNERSKSA